MQNIANPEKDARETVRVLLELSSLLCIDLDPEALTICVRLCEAGVNPEALATIVKELRKEVRNVNKTSSTCLPSHSNTTT